MDNTTPFTHIPCHTLADVSAKYASRQAQEHYSFLLCSATMDALDGTTLDDYSEVTPDNKSLYRVNLAIKKDIDADTGKAVDAMYNEASGYIAGLASQGVLQMLPASALRRLRRLLDAFKEAYGMFMDRKPDEIISREPDFSPYGDGEYTGQINHYSLLFRIDRAKIYETVRDLGKSLDGISRRIHALVAEELLDSLIHPTKTPDVPGEPRDTQEPDKPGDGKSPAGTETSTFGPVVTLVDHSTP